jgi:integrase
MPRKAATARLWLKPEQRDEHGNVTRVAHWVIKDGDHRASTGCGANDRRGAEQALVDYLKKKHIKQVNAGVRAPADIPVADVVSLYITDVVEQPRYSCPKDGKARFKRLLAFFGRDTLDQINGQRCRDYVAHRNGMPVARRELEDLRAAIIHHRKEGKCNAIVEIVLPERSPPRERWLTRSEAARLIRSAWRYREVQKGQKTDRASRQHIARFLVAALYTTRRKGAILDAALGPASGRSWIDLERGIYYGRKGANESKKRQPTIVVPPRLLAHLRRWKKNGQRNVIEYQFEAIGSIDKAFTQNVKVAGLGPDVTPHTTRHTGITWLAIEGVDPYEICRYAGITMEVFEEVYAHHHPDFMTGVHKGFTRHRDRNKNGGPLVDRYSATKREQYRSNVTKTP